LSGSNGANAVGEIVANTEVKIIKEDGTEAGVNEAGEILARGPQIIMGYLNNEKATRETYDADGFLHTGDQGRIDEHGMIWILDRIKEMIKVKRGFRLHLLNLRICYWGIQRLGMWPSWEFGMTIAASCQRRLLC
jgi:long-subunit acyl-CoA synthetase (AMP-forming)